MSKEHEIRSAPLFARCPADQVRWIARNADVIEIAGGTTLWRRGDRPREFVVVLAGRLSTSEGGEERIWGPGSHFGERELLDDGVRAITVSADGPVRLLVMGVREFRGLLDVAPGVARELLRATVVELRAAQTSRSLRAVS